MVENNKKISNKILKQLIFKQIWWEAWEKDDDYASDWKQLHWERILEVWREKYQLDIHPGEMAFLFNELTTKIT